MSFTPDKIRRIIINPFNTVNIDPGLTEEHAPLVEREKYIQANALFIRDEGPEAWLRLLLDVLSGAAVTADEVYAEEGEP
jgi:hypothetical protein